MPPLLHLVNNSRVPHLSSTVSGFPSRANIRADTPVCHYGKENVMRIFVGAHRCVRPKTLTEQKNDLLTPAGSFSCQDEH